MIITATGIIFNLTDMGIALFIGFVIGVYAEVFFGVYLPPEKRGGCTVPL
jgi:hypothetical protein